MSRESSNNNLHRGGGGGRRSSTSSAGGTGRGGAGGKSSSNNTSSSGSSAGGGRGSGGRSNQGSSKNHNNNSGRGGRSGGGGRGSGGGSGRGEFSTNNSNKNSGSHAINSTTASTSHSTNTSSSKKQQQQQYERDEDVLIAFMPFVKSNNSNAMKIHQQYQHTNDFDMFLKSARLFLIHQQDHEDEQQQQKGSEEQVALSVSAITNDDNNNMNNEHTRTTLVTNTTNNATSNNQGIKQAWLPTPVAITQNSTMVNPSHPTEQESLVSRINNNNTLLSTPNTSTAQNVQTKMTTSMMTPPQEVTATTSSIQDGINSLFITKHFYDQAGHSTIPATTSSITGSTPHRTITSSIDPWGSLNSNYSGVLGGADILTTPPRYNNDSGTISNNNNNIIEHNFPTELPPTPSPLLLSSPWNVVGQSQSVQQQQQHQQQQLLFQNNNTNPLQQQHLYPQQQQQHLFQSASALPTMTNANKNNINYFRINPSISRNDHSLKDNNEMMTIGGGTILPPQHSFLMNDNNFDRHDNNDRLAQSLFLSSSLVNGGDLNPLLQNPTTAVATSATSERSSTALTSTMHEQQQEQPQQQQKLPPTPPLVPTPTPPKKEQPQLPPVIVSGYGPKRLWTHLEQQIGIIKVNGVAAMNPAVHNVPSIPIQLGPREEIIAHWSIPVTYLIQHDAEVKLKASSSSSSSSNNNNNNKNDNPTRATPEASSFQLKDALQDLTIGLFRRGCSENSSSASIVSKGVSGFEYYHDPATQSICGKVPFFTPRTPGNVLFRMYWDSVTTGSSNSSNESIYTLGTGPAIRVRVSEHEFENSIRFILSNLKGRSTTVGGTATTSKPSSPTSLSSLISFASILETHLSGTSGGGSRNHGQHHHSRNSNIHHNNNHNNSSGNIYESASRATFGCIQESRKVIDSCFQEYQKTSARLKDMEKEIEELKKKLQVAQQQKKQQLSDDLIIETTTTTISARDVTRTKNNKTKSGSGNENNDDDEDDDDGKDNNNDDVETTITTLTTTIHEKTRTLLTNKASSERKWKDSQVAFASILNAIINNASIGKYLLRRDIINKIHLEYVLYCPLVEEFATPSSSGGGGNDSSTRMWYEALDLLLQTHPSNNSNHHHQHGIITPDDMRRCTELRSRMQIQSLGFAVNTAPLDEILYMSTGTNSTAPSSSTVFNNNNNANRGSNQRNSPHQHRPQQQQQQPTTTPMVMDPGAVNTFNSISAAMGQYYQELHANEDVVVQQREMIRLYTQQCVDMCGAFPPGTEVVIFGSSANGFGSPKSDIDMCLHIPEGATLLVRKNSTEDVAHNHNREDGTNHNGTGDGDEKNATVRPDVLAMTRLAEYFKDQSEMRNVDTVRLTARIPIVQFHCPVPKISKDATEGKTSHQRTDEAAIIDTITDDNNNNNNGNLMYVECDISMHNPLAVLNTTFLRQYAEITPITRVLMATIKRWAKARDINSPAKHTLSSYGYAIMLLHFLTYHKRTGTGIVQPIVGETSSNNDNNNNNGSDQGSGNRSSSSNGTHETPILPNLHWVDPNWIRQPPTKPLNSSTEYPSYREVSSIPRRLIQHPMKQQQPNDQQQQQQPHDQSAVVNTYFYRPTTVLEKNTIQQLFAGQDLSLSILLASFFRYYAYEFDYKRHIVSLHSTKQRGIVERDVKAEYDSWRTGGNSYNSSSAASLTIEDPFETGYDVAHVLRGGNYHCIRRELALAYTKIATAATASSSSSSNRSDSSSSLSSLSTTSWHTKGETLRTLSGQELLDWICEPVGTSTNTNTADTATTPTK